MSQEKRIAMWSVPRSLATVLSRAWASRPDTVVYDELLFPPYLLLKGEDFGFTREDLIDTPRETDWRKVIAELTGPLPEGKTISYQKHQAHNLIVEVMGIEWIKPFANCFLIRQPKDVLLSIHKIVPHFTFQQTGWAELKKLFDYVCETSGTIPPVIDARDLQDQPRQTLSLLCDRVDVEFTEAMLHWESFDASLLSEREQPWYSAVLTSTHFEPYKANPAPLPDHLIGIWERCDEIYQQLYAYRLC